MLVLDAAERHYHRGDPVVQKGDVPTSLMLVLTGKLKVTCQSPEGNERVVDILAPGQTYGEMAVSLGTVHALFITALVRAQVLHIDLRAIRQLAARVPGFRLRLMMSLSERILMLKQDIVAISCLAPTQRIASYLLAASRPTQAVVELPVYKWVIASRLAMTPEAFSRALRDFVESGIIAVRGKHLHILDRGRLAALAA
ncbi:Crp/Fnr family transcriptional regulator [Rhodocyclaceae bacterium]